MRLFVAIDLDEDARQAIGAEQKRIAKAIDDDRSALKWIDPAQMHLTLAFLGEIADRAAPPLVDAMSAALDVAPFVAVFQHLGVFPTSRAPRVLWLGVTQGARELATVQRTVADRLRPLAAALDERPFHAHLTLARWRTSRPRDATRALSCDRHTIVARTAIDRVTLYRSRLSTSGPSYTPLARATLK